MRSTSPVLWLEPTGTHEGDTGTAEGVDRAPYFFAQETHVILQIHDSADQVQHVLLKHASGREVARYERGMETTVVPVQSGAYLLEVHHAHKGQAEAPAQRIFEVQTWGRLMSPPWRTPSSKRRGRGSDAHGKPGLPNCNFSNADLTGEDFSDVDLSGANFHRANLTNAKFLRATMLGAKLASAQPEANGDILDEGDPTIMDGTDFTGADCPPARPLMAPSARRRSSWIPPSLITPGDPGWPRRGASLLTSIRQSCTGRTLAVPGSKAPRLMASSSSAAILRG